MSQAAEEEFAEITESSTDPVAEEPAEARSQFRAADCPVKHVTVFLDRAEVCRVIAVRVPAGESEVVLSELTPAIDKDSIRVEVLGAATITDVSYTARSDKEDESRKAQQREETAKALTEEERNLESLLARLQRLQRQRSVLNSYADMLIHKPSAAVPVEDKELQPISNGSHLLEAYDPKHMDTLNSFFDLYDKQAGKLDEEILEARQVIVNKEAQIRRLETELRDIEAKFAELLRREVSILLESQATAQVELHLSYVVTRARWSPKYDIRVFSNESAMKIIYYGMVQQQTGEDWQNAQLSLSTCQPGTGGSAPAVCQQRAHFKSSRVLSVVTGAASNTTAASASSPVRRAHSMRAAAARRTRIFDDPVIGSEAEEASVTSEQHSPSQNQQQQQPQPLPQQQQQVQQVQQQQTPVRPSNVQSAQFEVPRLFTIPAGPVEQKVTIGIIDLCPTFEYESVPQRAPFAYLKATVTNTSSYALLAGPANVYVDNNFVAKSDLKAAAPSEEFSCNLGADHGIKVVYRPMFKNKEPSQKTVTYLYKQVIEMQNLHLKPIRVLVMESLPYAVDEKIKVSLQEPHIKNQDKYDRSKPIRVNKSKFVEWDVDLEANESKELVLRYSIAFPQGECLDYTVSDI